MAANARCFGDGQEDYERYHDVEWARPALDSPDEHELFERMSLEAFQSGLSWLTILRKRDGFRAAFDGFNPETVAAFDDDDVARLMNDAGIVRNQAKILATIGNARALQAMHARGERLRDIFESHRPNPSPPPSSLADVPAQTPESRALAKELKSLGFAFVGPTTAYAAMQALGIVNDHLASCPTREVHP